MTAHRTEGRLTLEIGVIDRLMPMHVWVGATGHILSAGATLRKLVPDDGLLGQRFLEVFQLKRPGDVSSVGDLLRHSGSRLQLQLRNKPQTAFRGIAVPLSDGQSVLINLSFGIAVAAAIREHRLTDADFAPTDLTVELLYLSEAKSAVMEELHNLNRRLHGAKSDAEERALTDTLTGLRNRRAMDKVMSGAVQSGTEFGMMHIDLDYFKQVNDTLGHAAGDHVLQCVAQILNQETRSDDTVARVGGDEFVIIFPRLVDPVRLNGIAERIIGKLSEPIAFEGKSCHVSASIGITVSTMYPEPLPDRMLCDADRALYMSKHKGRARATTYSPEMENPLMQEAPSRPHA